MPSQTSQQARALARSERDAPTTDLQRRANGHDVRGQLAHNAQFKRQMIAQMRGQAAQEDTTAVLNAAAQGVQGSGGALPYLDTIQKSFGHHNVSAVQAFVGGQAKTASDAIGAEAYATGNSVAFRASPTLHTAAHEAAHIVQQRAGVQLSGGVGQVGDRYERHADAVADRVVQGKSAADLLDQFTGMTGPAAEAGVQRKEAQAGRGPTMKQDGPTPAQIDHLRASVAKTNVYLRAIIKALDRYSHYHSAIRQAAGGLRGFLRALSAHAQRAASGMGVAGRVVSIITGIDRMLRARKGSEFVSACLDTGVHLAMGSTPLTAVLDMVLTAVVGADWPTKLAYAIADFFDHAFERYFQAWDDHREGTGEALIPAGPRKM